MVQIKLHEISIARRAAASTGFQRSLFESHCRRGLGSIGSNLNVQSIQETTKRLNIILVWVLGLTLATAAQCQSANAPGDGLVELRSDSDGLIVVTLPNPRCGARTLLAEFALGQTQSVKIGFTGFYPPGATLRVTADGVTFELGELSDYRVRRSRCANLVLASGVDVGLSRFLQITNAKTVSFFVSGDPIQAEPNDIDLLRKMAARLMSTK